MLTPGGALGLICNERDESVEWVASLIRAMCWDQHQPYEIGTDFSHGVAAGPFRDVERVEFRHAQTLTREGVYQRVLTTSYITLLEGHRREALMKDVASEVEQLPEPIMMPYVTSLYTAKATLSIK